MVEKEERKKMMTWGAIILIMLAIFVIIRQTVQKGERLLDFLQPWLKATLGIIALIILVIIIYYYYQKQYR
ncbi:MAG: hypothetical protein GWN01_17710 [Nitrosopumilaceae archaeon]|nr:hypothetical protein [Nitrosopumilaceae archaeon]NIU89114.1 hypothetical protein [Nitrosopumilaceae archaeon]NIV67222.1 hypothetical protein [Nitrosopumilaceae archaeon]NIX63260.1 hypothetical protein [Nitrosopumilaceae archaeon]